MDAMPSSIKFEFYFFWSGLAQTVRFYARHQDSESDALSPVRHLKNALDRSSPCRQPIWNVSLSNTVKRLSW
jgi:hypothetical protein